MNKDKAALDLLDEVTAIARSGDVQGTLLKVADIIAENVQLRADLEAKNCNEPLPPGKLISIAAELAARRPLRPLEDLCQRQKSVSTARLIETVLMCGDTLAQIACEIRQAHDKMQATIAQQAEGRPTQRMSAYDAVMSDEWLPPEAGATKSRESAPGLFCQACGNRLHIRGTCTIFCPNKDCRTFTTITKLESQQCEHTESPCSEQEKNVPASPYTTWAK